MEELLNAYVTPARCAKTLRVSRARVGQLMREKRLETVLTPLGRLVSKASLAKLQRERHRAKTAGGNANVRAA